MTPVPILLVLAGIILYFVYKIYINAMHQIGFTEFDAIMILIVSYLAGYIDISVVKYNNIIIAVNVGGAIIPCLISAKLLFKHKTYAEAIIATTVVSMIAYTVTFVTNDGIVSPFPQWLAPPFVASICGFVFANKLKKASSIAYISGTLGSLIGADLMHLNEILRLDFDSTVIASIGGASIFDMVYLAGILAIMIELILYKFIKEGKLEVWE